MLDRRHQDYERDWRERYDAHIAAFVRYEETELEFRSALHGLGFRGAEIDGEVRLHKELRPISEAVERLGFVSGLSDQQTG